MSDVMKNYVFYSNEDSVAVRSNHFLLVEWLFDAKVLQNGHAVTQNYVFVICFFNQKELKTIPTTNWPDTLKRQKPWKSLSILEQTSNTWHRYLTVWLRSVTLIQSVFVIKPNFCRNWPSSYIEHGMLLIVYCEFEDQEWWW